MVEHEICLLTCALGHIGHVNNTARSSQCTADWIYNAQVPLNNASVLGNHREYRHK